MSPATASTRLARYSGLSATTAPAEWRTRSPRTASIDWCGDSGQLGFLIGAHALRATAATHAHDHQADIAKVQEWLGHANIATTRIYDRRARGPRTARRSRSPTDEDDCLRGNAHVMIAVVMANASQDGGGAKHLRGVRRLFWLFSTEIDLDQRMGS